MLQFEQSEESIVHYEELIRRGTTNATSFENLATCYLQRGEPDKARRTMEMHLSRNPESSAGHDDLGLVQVMLGRYEEAVAAYSRAELLNPTDSLPPFGYAMAQLLNENWDAATGRARPRHQPLKRHGNGSEISS